MKKNKIKASIKKKKKKGFTLIELLAVIVILGVLMVIAIPSVTEYIQTSRKNALLITIDNYINATMNKVNSLEFQFMESDKIYAVPIECLPVEKGGDNPFGDWHQASDEYWAYVLVQFDSTDSSYTYGFTFKDSANQGIYPTSKMNLLDNTQIIESNIDLIKPKTGIYTNIAEKDDWKGFNIQDNTNVIILEAESENTSGDGKNTCTLVRKGENYEKIEAEKKTNLSKVAKLGDYVMMTPSSTGFKTDPAYTGNSVEQTINPSELDVWRVIKKNDDGTIEMVSEKTSSIQIGFSKIKGYVNYIGYLNLIAKQYENSDYTISSRAMGYNGQTEFLDYDSLSIHESTFLSTTRYICKTTTVDNSNEKIGCGDVLYETDVELVKKALGTLQAKMKGRSHYSGYWLASRYAQYNPSSVHRLYMSSRLISNDGSVSSLSLKTNCTNSCAVAGGALSSGIRPIVVLKADLKIVSGNGSEASPYKISVND